MQTFLPYADFERSVVVLDRQRLGKQRVEARQIWTALMVGNDWRHHPAVRMWRGYEEALAAYGDAAIREWVWRGYRNTLTLSGVLVYELPPWLGDENFHRSHRSNLRRKLPAHYAPLFPGVPDNLPYVWPV
jgi:hypothetical protein